MKGTSKRKIDAIYELRSAAERKALAEKALDDGPSSEKRDELLDAKLALEKKTIEAIETCHECGHEHATGTPHLSERNDIASIDDQRKRKESSN